MSLRFVTAGESHGPGLVVVVWGLPHGVPVSRERVDAWLQRRQKGLGRGGRQRIEKDRIQAWSGIRHGRTTGGPVALTLDNKDHGNWGGVMDPWGRPGDGARRRAVNLPRPGHADLPGALRYGLEDARDVLERASARETAARTAAGALAAEYLRPFGVEIRSCVRSLGPVAVEGDIPWEAMDGLSEELPMPPGPWVEEARTAVERAAREGETLGGVVEVAVRGCPPGLGGHESWERRLDGRFARALMSIPAVKAVEVGEGFSGAALPGSRFHDPILEGFRRPTNRCGGLEGGMTNGSEIRLRCAMKPLATLRRGLPSRRLDDGSEGRAHFERTDVTAVVPLCVVAAAAAAWVTACAHRLRVGGERLDEALERWRMIEEDLRSRGWRA